MAWTDDHFFITGAARSADQAAFVLSNQEADAALEPQSRILVWDKGEWAQNVELGWNAVNVCPMPASDDQWIVVGQQGEVCLISRGGLDYEFVGVGKDSPAAIGMLSLARTIGNGVYAIGPARQAYRRIGKGRWDRIDQDCRVGEIDNIEENEDEFYASFDSIDGFSEDELYAVGGEGAIWCRQNTRWRRIHTDTNINLCNIVCAPDGTAYACGLAGTLLRGRGDEWERIATESGINEDLWGICWYQNKLMLACMSCVFVLEDDDLVPYEFDPIEPNTCYQLVSAENHLWSIGTNDLLLFDGKSWTRID